MKTVLKNYSLSTSARTITLTDITTVRLDRLALITDVTTNKILYNFADSTVSTATVLGNVVTLSALQGGESNSDKLRIDYDVDTTDVAFGDSVEAVKILPATPVPSISSTIQGEDIAITAPGTQLTSLAGPTGDPIDTVGDSLSVSVANTGSTIRGDPGQNSLITASARREVSYQTAAAAAVAFTDISNYRWVSVQQTSTGTTAITTWQISNDGVNWVGLGLMPSTNLGSTIGVVSTASNSIWTGAISARYFRLNVTGITAGTTQGVVEFFSAIGSNLQTTSNVASVSAAPIDGQAAFASLFVAAFPALFNGTTYDRQRSVSASANTTGTGLAGAGAMGIFNNVPPTITSGNYERLQLDNNANLKVTFPTGKIIQTDKATIDGETPSTTAPGIQLISLAGPTGDAIDTTGNALNVTAASSSSIGSITPPTAFYNGIKDTSGNLIGASSGNAAAGTVGNGLIGSAQMVWDGTFWQKQPADSTGVPKVNVALSPAGTTLNTYSVHLTTSTTTTPIASLAYISAISISSEVAGTTSSITIQDKQGTPLKLINGLSTTSLTTTPTTVNFQTPVKMVGGIDIVTAGAVAATVDVWINYYS